MQKKEIEKVLQEKADKIEMREFSQVWDEIKGEINSPEKKKIRWKKWLPMACASAVLVVCVVLLPFLIDTSSKPIPPAEEVYYADVLEKQDVLESEMLEGLVQAGISHVELDEYTLGECGLLITEDNKIKGASTNIYNNPTTFFAKVDIYDKSVDLKINLVATYDAQCKVNSTDVYYKLKQESGGMYEYIAYAVHNKVQYAIEYTGFSDNLIEFLNDFFA